MLTFDRPEIDAFWQRACRERTIDPNVRHDATTFGELEFAGVPPEEIWAFVHRRYFGWQCKA